MYYYFAPMEGLTDSIYRKWHHRFFPGVHRYYTPFFSPTVHRSLTTKERRELIPADMLDFEVVPQVLTKCPEDFLWMAQQCQAAGYQEVNLNLGCPSGTVTAKGKGSGALRDPDNLDRFLNDIFKSCPIPISVKTRIGFSSAEEFPVLLNVFNQYPIKELTIHPRTRADFYNGPVNMDSFLFAVNNSKNPLCFNGNICSSKDIDALLVQHPRLNAVMIGRALIGDPGMLSPGGTDRATLQHFHNALFEEYTEAFGSGRNALSRMKENWHYLICRFADGEKLFKKLRKTTDVKEYQTISQEIFTTLPLREALSPNW